MMDDNDRYSLKLCAWKEARGDGAGAMFWVMRLCLNRVGKPGFASTLHDVIYGKNQFTSMSVPTDPEFNLQPDPNDPMWLVAGYQVENIEGTDDPSGGRALYYQNPKTAQKGGWFERNIGGPDGLGTPEHPLLAKIAHHFFYA